MCVCGAPLYLVLVKRSEPEQNVQITYVSGDPTQTRANTKSSLLAGLSEGLLKRIYITYWMDFAAFNYTIDEYLP